MASVGRAAVAVWYTESTLAGMSRCRMLGRGSPIGVKRVKTLRACIPGCPAANAMLTPTSLDYRGRGGGILPAKILSPSFKMSKNPVP